MYEIIPMAPLILAVLAVVLLGIKTFTLVGFAETQSCDGLTKVAALADEHVTVSGDDITVPELNKIMGCVALDPDGIAAQLQSPSLRRLLNPDIFPLWTGTNFNWQFPPYHDFKANPLELERSEKLNALIDNAANSAYGVFLVWLADGTPVPVSGDIRTLKATMTGGSTAYAWTNQALTLSQTLPAGKYGVVGMQVRPASVDQMIAARLSFVGESWRPGIIAGVSAIDQRPEIFRNGHLGVWGEFEFDQPPTVDYLTIGATGAIEVFLDLVQLRAGR